MANLQDKICNGLTLAGLLCVIGFGIASLIPGRAETEGNPSDACEPEEPEAEQMLTDTLREVPMIEDKPMEVKPDTQSVSADSVHSASVKADTARHVPVHHETAPAEPREVHPGAEPKAEPEARPEAKAAESRPV